MSYSGHGFLGLPDLETAKQCILETVTVLEMRKSVTVADCHCIDVIVTDMHCKEKNFNPHIEVPSFPHLMLRFPPILAGTKSHLDLFHQPLDMGILVFPVTVYRPNPNATLAFSQATCSPAEGTKLRCRRCLSFFVSKIEITRRTYLPSNHRDAAAPAEALGIRLVIQLRIIYTA